MSEDIDIIEYLHILGADLAGLNADPKARALVLRYAKERLDEGKRRVEEEIAYGYGDDGKIEK